MFQAETKINNQMAQILSKFAAESEEEESNRKKQICQIKNNFMNCVARLHTVPTVSSSFQSQKLKHVLSKAFQYLHLHPCYLIMLYSTYEKPLSLKDVDQFYKFTKLVWNNKSGVTQASTSLDKIEDYLVSSEI
jgi:hypothetical protein